ncbi:MAG TPA: hypothetical protein VLM80_00430 [Anaerolineales bacterium]|nr:hypothetical protein [Anaerolineales bacterium]
MAWSPEDTEAPLATPLFASEFTQRGFLSAAPVSPRWQPGMSLVLTGPCGHGFDLPVGVRCLALAAFGNSAARLLPIILNESREGQSIALFTDCNLPPLPAEVEINPLDALAVILNWADFLVCDMPLNFLAEFRARMMNSDFESITGIPGQVLITTAMPCGGVSDCGACAVPIGKSYQLACKDGPVFDLQELLD